MFIVVNNNYKEYNNRNASQSQRGNTEITKLRLDDQRLLIITTPEPENTCNK